MSDSVYEVGANAMVTAWHVMPGMEGPEGELHSHDYRVDVVVARDELDEQGMVCDLDVLRAALGAAIDRVRDRNLEVIQPDAAEAVTVEIFARWMHDQLHSALEPEGVSLQVRIWETPEAFGGYASSSS
ncbi:MAG: 6-pyruvoyl trahydropterin synthase family protein [Acidimicrobiia bacterium]